MYLMYADESGNTGTDYDNKEQPILSLAGIVVEDKKWHEINDYFEEEKNKLQNSIALIKEVIGRCDYEIK